MIIIVIRIHGQLNGHEESTESTDEEWDSRYEVQQCHPITEKVLSRMVNFITVYACISSTVKDVVEFAFDG